MKKLLPVLLATSYLLLATATANAQTLTPASDRPLIRPKLDTIRNEKKRSIVERVDKNITQINTSRTNIMTRHLTKIEEILNKIEIRALEVEKSGKDISSVKTAIATARAAIATAKSIVVSQSTKIYTIDITSEANLGSAVSTTRTAFAKDLQAAHQAVVTARKSVRDVLVVLAKVVGERLTNTVEK